MAEIVGNRLYYRQQIKINPAILSFRAGPDVGRPQQMMHQGPSYDGENPQEVNLCNLRISRAAAPHRGCNPHYPELLTRIKE